MILIGDSVEQPQIPILIRYILIDFAIFSMTLIIGIKLLGSSMNRLLRCLLVGLIGAIISTALIDRPTSTRICPIGVEIQLVG
jgi:hypothetical protein